MSSHYPSSSKYGGTGSSYSRNRDSDRGRDRGREWRRNERDRSRDRDRQRSTSPRDRNNDRRYNSDRGGGRGRRQNDYNSSTSLTDRDRLGGRHGSRFNRASSPSPSSSSIVSSLSLPGTSHANLIREKDLGSTSKMFGGYNNPHYGNFHYNTHGHYGFPNPSKGHDGEGWSKEREKDLKKDPLFNAALEACIKSIKTKGDYDQIRKECLSDIDTKAAFINLHTRIKTTVDKYLNLQVYKKDMDKVKTREGMRKKILDTPYFNPGIESVVNQIIQPKIAALIRPKVEEEVFKHLNIKRDSVTNHAQGGMGMEGVNKEEVEKKITPVISTKEIAFHTIMPSKLKETKPIIVATPVTSTSGPPKAVERARRRSSESGSESDRNNDDDSEEQVATPMYSPAGKTPIPTDDEEDENVSLRHSEVEDDESQGSLQIDDSAERRSNSPGETQESASMSIEADEGNKTSTTPVFPEDGASPIPPPSIEHSRGQMIFQPQLPPLPPGSGCVILTQPPPSFLMAQPMSPPPLGDDTACSSPPRTHYDQFHHFSSSRPQQPYAGDEDDEEEPLPPGEEPESYFSQLRGKSYSYQQPAEVKKNANDTPHMNVPKPEKNSEIEKVKDTIAENLDEEEMDEDSDEESPMFEKIGEVSPPRVTELQDSELVHELSKSILSQAGGSEKASPSASINSNSNSMQIEEKNVAPPEKHTQNQLENCHQNSPQALLNEEVPLTEKAETIQSDSAKQVEVAITETEVEEKVPALSVKTDKEESNVSSNEHGKFNEEECKFLETIPDHEYKISYYKRIPNS